MKTEPVSEAAESVSKRWKSVYRAAESASKAAESVPEAAKSASEASESAPEAAESASEEAESAKYSKMQGKSMDLAAKRRLGEVRKVRSDLGPAEPAVAACFASRKQIRIR